MAVPISWDELEKLDRANGFYAGDAAKRATDKKHNPWPGYFDVKQPITQAMLKAVGARIADDLVVRKLTMRY